MTPEARASAIRRALKDVDIHINALIDREYKVNVVSLYADNQRKHLRTAVNIRKMIEEKL